MKKFNAIWVAAVLIYVTSPGWATSLYWDIDGATAGAGGASPNGAWDGTNTFWNSDSTGAGGGTLIAAPATNDALFLSAGTNATGGYTITLVDTQNANSVTIEDGAPTIIGGTLNLAANSQITVNSGHSVLIGSTISGAGTQLTINGAGIVTFSSSNAFTGTTLVTGAGHGYSGSFATVASLILFSATGPAINGNLSLGSGGAGCAILQTQAANQFGSKAVLTINAVGGFPNGYSYFELFGNNQTIAGLDETGGGGGSATVENTEGETGIGNSILTINTAAGTSYAFSGFVRNGSSGTLGLIKQGAGTQTFNGNYVYAYTGATDVQQGVLTFSNITGLASPVLTNNATVMVVMDSGTLAYAGVLAGTGTVVKVGAGSLMLNATNSFGGQVAVLQGSFGLAAAGQLAGSVTVSNNAALVGGGAYGGAVTLADGAVLSPGSSGVFATVTCGNLALGNSTNTFDLSVSGGDKVIVTNSLTSASGTIYVNLLGPLTNGIYPLLIYSNSFSGSFSPVLHTTARGTFTLTNIPNAIALSVVGGANADLAWYASVNTNWDTGVSPNWLMGASQTFFYQGDGVTFDDTGVVSNQINLVGTVQPRSVTVNAAGNYVLGGQGSLGGTTSVFKAGSGTLTLAGANTYTGLTTISSGTVVVANALALQNSTVDFSGYGGALSFGGVTNVTLGGLRGNQFLVLTNDSAMPVLVNIGNNNGASTYSGVLSGSGALTTVGSGTLTLTGSNAYTGDTVVSGQGHSNYGASPSLVLSNAVGPAIQGSKLYLGRVSNSGHATIDCRVSNQFPTNMVIYFNGANYSMVNLWGSTQTVAGIQMFNGTGGYGTLQNVEGASGAGNAVMIINTATNTSYIWYGITRDTGGTSVSLVKMGPGTQHLAGNAIGHSGPTVVKEGRMESESLSASAKLDIQGGTFAFIRSNAGGVTTSMTTLTGSGTYEVNLYQSSDILDPFWTASAKTITMGTNSLFYVKRGTLRLGYGNIDWSGNRSGLTLDSGASFDIWDSPQGARFDALNGSGTVTDGNGNGTLYVGAADGSGMFSGTITQAVGWVVGFTKIGSGTQTLSGTNSYQGITTVSGGALIVNGLNNGTGIVSVLSGATLAGTGIVAGAISVASGGVCAPGIPVSWSGLGRFSTTNINFSSNSTFRVRITKARNDRLSAGYGVVSLGNAALDIVTTNEYIPGGTEYVVMDAASITGTFAGCPNGTASGAGVTKFAVWYVGGTNVVLRALSAGTLMIVQ